MRTRFCQLVCGLVWLFSLGCSNDHGRTGSKAPSDKPFRMAMMPKITAIAYFNACERGAREAAKELGIAFTFDGPTKNDVQEQKEILRQWIADGYDCIAIAPNDPSAVAGVLEDARRKGIIVLTFDADADRGRQYFINQATYEDIAQALIDSVVEEIGPEGKVGILTSTLQAPNQSEWAKRMRSYRDARFPGLNLLSETESEESSTLGIDRAKSLIQTHADLKAIIGLTSIATPSAAEAVIQQGKKGLISVVGLSTPVEMKKYVNNGTVKSVILWKPIDLGYLTVYVADLVRKGLMKGEGTIQAGRLGTIHVRNGYEVLLGPPMRFNRDNINNFDF